MLIIKIIVAFIVCSLKYLVGIATILFLNIGFTFSVILSVLGGMFGVVVFFYGRLYLVKTFAKPKNPNKIRISRMRRFMVNMRRKKAIWLIAFLTPIILQVPVGTLIASSFEKNFFKIAFPMFVSFLTYSLVIFGLFYIFEMQESLFFKNILKLGSK